MEKSDISGQLEVLTIRNSRNTELKILNFGATIFSLKFRQKTETINVVVGPEHPEDYLTDIYHKRGKFFGSSLGRYAGRISKGGFKIDGRTFPVYNEDGVHLHGGKSGFSYKFWNVEEICGGKDPSVLLSYLSKDGEEGYPGNLRVHVRYTLFDDDKLQIDYSAETDRETIVNLTNHTYFNLQGKGDVTKHQLQIKADKILEVDEKLIPTGNFLKVENTPKDFRNPKAIAEIPLDSVFSLSKEDEEKIILKSPESGISLRVFTSQPAVVVYIPENLPQDWPYSTKISKQRQAICLETQNFPDSPHHSAFPSARLKPGEKYRNSTIWKFDSGGKL